VLPSFVKVLVSKIFTAKLIDGCSVDLATVLNSQTSAPLLTQARRGLKWIFALRLMITVLIIALNVAYKFSFVAVPALGSMRVETSKVIELGDTEAKEFPVSKIVLQAMALDRMGYQMNDSSDAIILKGPSQTFFGPSFDVTDARQMIEGTVSACNPVVYLRTVATQEQPLDDSWVNRSPKVRETPYLNGIRFQDLEENTYIADVTSQNGVLQVFQAARVDASRAGVGYWTATNLPAQKCYGWVSWSKHFGSEFWLEDPVDIECQSYPFPFNDWRDTPDGATGISLANATLAKYSAIDWKGGAERIS
jgi:hypothetical protein